jgi:protein phosphatase PTC2/3
MSSNCGFDICQLSIDHKPIESNEKKRITNAGGKIVQVECMDPFSEKLVSIYRTIPGGLAVSRSIGDLEVKIPDFGGVTGVICPIPDILSFDAKNNMDFIILGSNILLSIP